MRLDSIGMTLDTTEIRLEDHRMTWHRNETWIV